MTIDFSGVLDGSLDIADPTLYDHGLPHDLFAAMRANPTLLRNPRVQDTEVENAFVLGLNGQLYLSAQTSRWGEWIVAEERPELEHDVGSFGIELETGGHFFKILLSNSARMNPTQILGGTPDAFTPDEWRLGFNVTRLLSF